MSRNYFNSGKNTKNSRKNSFMLSFSWLKTQTDAFEYN